MQIHYLKSFKTSAAFFGTRCSAVFPCLSFFDFSTFGCFNNISRMSFFFFLSSSPEFPEIPLAAVWRAVKPSLS